MQQLHGNLTGLAPSEKQMLERIYRRRVPAAEVVTEELGHFLVQCSTAIKRQVGALIDRAGTVTHVIVGDSRKLVLPDLGRHRAGRGRLRGLRLIHTHLGPEPLTRDDLIDLAKLRLDLVGAIGISRGGQPERLYLAHLLPKNPQDELWRELTPAPLHRVDVQFDELIRALEEELARAAAAAAVVEDGRDRAVVVQVIVTGQHGARGRSDRGPARPFLGLGPGPAAGSTLLPGYQGTGLGTGWDPLTRGAELRELCRTAGLQVLDVITQRRAELDPRFLLGKGKLEEVVLRALQVDATLLVFDPELTPAQARAISDATELKVIDRTMLILDIFAQHAHSRDGKLQVELAQLKYALPRLIEKNTMMSRLTGGIGGRGPGETKLEVSRRRARERITQLSHQIDALSRERAERRKQRGRRNLPVVAIVGYTNAGKSTLLNTLTHSQVTAENKLFATLDPTSRRMRFPDERELILTDTVGFIRDLPEDLRAAFRATLEELHEADLLLHVIDASDPAAPAHLRSVEQILGELGLLDKPRILVYNKLDRLSPEALSNLPQERAAVLLSAADPETVRPLLLAMDQALGLSPERRHWQGWPGAQATESQAAAATAAPAAESDRYSTPGDLT
jgi:GTP-binding protein HflX